MQAFPGPDPLSRRLQEWRVRAPRDPLFRARVHARLEPVPAGVTWPEFARRHALGVSLVVLLALAAGAAGGRGWARSHDAALSVRLAEEYVGALDARLIARR
jgi:hypothetical protein